MSAPRGWAGPFLKAASAEWPSIDVTLDEFERHLAERIPADAPLAEALARLHVSDLYLACGCALGRPGAIAVFERGILRGVDSALGQSSVPRPVVEEVQRQLREHLLVAREGRPPRIAAYTGQGRLRAWVGVSATRLLVSAMRKSANRAVVEGDDALAELPSLADDPELDYLKRYYRTELRDSFREALAALTDRDRNLLRYHFLDGLSQEQIAAIYRAPRSTVQRWLEKARGTLFAETRRGLRRRLRVTRSELDSILRLIESRFDASLQGLFRGPPAP